MTAIFNLREGYRHEVESQQIAERLRAVRPKEEPGAFEGSLTAIPRAVGSLTARAFRGIGELGEEFAIDNPEMVSKDTAEYFSGLQSRAQHNYLRMRADPVKHGAVSVAAQQLAEIGIEAGVIAGFTGGLGTLPLVGRLGATGLGRARTATISSGVGGIEYAKIKSDLMEFDKLDERTASRVAAFQAASIGVGLALPYSLGLKSLGDIGYNIAANVGMGMSERTAVSDELSRSGYNAMADNYRAIGGVEVLTDALFGAVLPAINKGAQAAADYRVSKALANAATEIQKASHQQTQAIVTTPAGRQGVYDAIALADTQIRNGRAVDIGDVANDVEFLVPTLESLEGDFKATVEYAKADGAKYVDIEAVRQEVVARSADAKAAASAEMAAKDAEQTNALIKPQSVVFYDTVDEEILTKKHPDLIRLVNDVLAETKYNGVSVEFVEKIPASRKAISASRKASGHIGLGKVAGGFDRENNTIALSAKAINGMSKADIVEILSHEAEHAKQHARLDDRDILLREQDAYRVGREARARYEESVSTGNEFVLEPKDVTPIKEQIAKDSAESYSRVEAESHDEAVIRSYSADADAKIIENARRVFGDEKIMDEDGVMRTLDEIYATSDNLIEVSIKEGKMIEELAYCASIMGGING